MNKRSAWLTALLLTGCSHSGAKTERYYVSLERGDAVAAIDPASGTIVQHFAAGKRPRGLKLSPDGSKLYVAVSGSPIGGPGVDESKLPPSNHGADGIAVLDLPSGKVDRVLAAGSDPETFIMSPDGRTIFVSNEDQSSVSAVAADGSRATRSAKVGDEPEGVAVTADGTRLFVACEGSDHVAMLDAQGLRVIRTIGIAGRPRTLLSSRDGSSIFVAAEGAGKVAVLSAADGAIKSLIDLAQGDKNVRPMGLAEGADGHVFVTTGRGGAIVELDPKAGAIVRSIGGVGARPWGIGISADQHHLVTANGPSDDLSVVDMKSGRIVRKIRTGGSPWGVVIARP